MDFPAGAWSHTAGVANEAQSQSFTVTASLPAVQIVDDGNPAFSLTGPDWPYRPNPRLTGYETDINIRRGGNKGENVARWSFNVQPGV